ncbi:MAG: hypothetical protein GC191_20025 [Azospirillum sp.]|nr:hypothetical protein [Azospirillum sp.]
MTTSCPSAESAESAVAADPLTDPLPHLSARWRQELMAALQTLAQLILRLHGPETRRGLAERAGEAWRAVRDLDPEAAARAVVVAVARLFKDDTGELGTQAGHCLRLALGLRPTLVEAVAAVNGDADRDWAMITGNGQIILHDSERDEVGLLVTRDQGQAIAALFARFPPSPAEPPADAQEPVP